jgi:hypothetical protein
MRTPPATSSSDNRIMFAVDVTGLPDNILAVDPLSGGFANRIIQLRIVVTTIHARTEKYTAGADNFSIVLVDIFSADASM